MAVFFNGLPGASAEADAVLSGRIDDISSGTIMPPIQSLVQLKAKPSAQLVDKALIHVEDTLFTWRWDEQSTETPDDIDAVKPDDITLPDPGRWEKHPTIVSSGGGSTMRDLAPTDYDVYVLSDGSGDYTDLTTAIHTLASGYSGHRDIYVGPGSYTWNHAQYLNNLTCRLIGAGKEQTIITTGSGFTVPFGPDSSGPGGESWVVYEMAHMTIINETNYPTNRTARIEFQLASPSYLVPTLPNGDVAAYSFHDIRYVYNGPSVSNDYPVILHHADVSNCEFISNVSLTTRRFVDCVYSRVANCILKAPAGRLISSLNGFVTGCHLYSDGSDGNGAIILPDDISGVSMISDCYFYMSSKTNAIEAEGAAAHQVRGCYFRDTPVANAYVGGANLVKTRNVYSDAVDS